MAYAKFLFKATKQIIETNDIKKIAKWKKDPKRILLEEVKAPRTRKPAVPEE